MQARAVYTNWRLGSEVGARARAGDQPKAQDLGNKKTICATPFVEHFIVLSDKIILNYGVTYQKIKRY